MPSTNFVQLIKQIAMDAVKASKPCDYCIGTIADSSPLEVKISNILFLDKNFLTITETAQKKDLKKGDKVLLLRKAGGQEYALIDKVV